MAGAFGHRVSHVTASLSANRLGVVSIVLFTLSAAAPLAVVSGVIPTGFATTGVLALPVAFVIVALVLGLFAVGFVTMAARVANAGALYTYVVHGLGRRVGVGAAWLALVAYNCLQIGLYGLIGAATVPLLPGWAGQVLPWWLVAVTAWAVVAILGLRRIDINGRVLAVLLIAEISLIVLLDVGNLAHPDGGQISTDPLSPAGLVGPGLGAVLVLAVLGFVGFEGSVVLSEEARDPRRTVRTATYVSLAVIAALYAVSAWSMTVTVGPDQIAAVAGAEGPELMYTLAADHFGPSVATAGRVLLVSSLLAAMISFHATVSRYIFALGREGVLPVAFGRTSATGAPKPASIAQSTASLTVIGIYAVGGWDPVLWLFYLGGAVGGLGVLLLLALASVAIVTYFIRNPARESWWHARLAPAAAAVLMVATAGLATVNFGTVLGPDAPAWLAIAVPLVYMIVTVGGIAYAVVLRHRRPSDYDHIGLGAHSVVARSSAPTTRQNTPSQRTASGPVERDNRSRSYR